uniref:Polyribonucleotide 5'-hydroxyl-kinase Clp1 P-loop domain-containing protein n=1 Tax=Panagrolaimus sp. PS1159 TaxID=55785 RepID=A0AC35EV98_9BILA
MQPTTDGPPASKKSNPYSPKIFYSDSVGFSATSPPLLDDGKEDVLCKRLTAIDFKFAPIKNAILNGGFSAILLLTDPPAKIKPIESITGWIIFKPLPMYVPVEVSPYYFMTNLVSESDKTKIYDFCQSVHHMWTSSMFEHLFKKIKPIESITGWTIFKPLPMYVPVELSPYYYMTNLVPESDKTNIYKFCQSVHHMWTSSNKSIAMIIGAKDSGKSTISKELCNVLLSTKPHIASTIYYLDCDVGQSEFTPPGLISIVKIDKPIL